MQGLGINKKKALLLCAFGTTIEEAGKTYDKIAERFSSEFPEHEVRRAYSSSIVREKLLLQGLDIPSPARAIAQFADDGYEELIVQSLHVIAGKEYSDISMTAKAMEAIPKGLPKIYMGEPLLWQHHDYQRLAQILIKYTKNLLLQNDAILLMGHGTNHPSNICYAGLQRYFQKEKAAIYVATMEAFPLLEDICTEMKDEGVKKLCLLPFLTVAGGHVTIDMAGAQQTSWMSLLKNEGFVVTMDSTPLGEIPEVVNMWIDKAKQAYSKESR